MRHAVCHAQRKQAVVQQRAKALALRQQAAVLQQRRLQVLCRAGRERGSAASDAAKSGCAPAGPLAGRGALGGRNTLKWLPGQHASKGQNGGGISEGHSPANPTPTGRPLPRHVHLHSPAAAAPPACMHSCRGCGTEVRRRRQAVLEEAGQTGRAGRAGRGRLCAS